MHEGIKFIKGGPVHKNQKEAPKIYKDGLPGLWGQPGAMLIMGRRRKDF